LSLAMSGTAALHMSSLSLHDALPISSMYLVAEWMTMSAPRSRGFCSAGVQKQLSTASSAPCSRATAARPRISTSSASGLDGDSRSEEHTSELQSRENLVCRLLLEKKK